MVAVSAAGSAAGSSSALTAKLIPGMIPSISASARKILRTFFIFINTPLFRQTYLCTFRFNCTSAPLSGSLSLTEKQS